MNLKSNIGIYKICMTTRAEATIKRLLRTTEMRMLRFSMYHWQHSGARIRNEDIRKIYEIQDVTRWKSMRVHEEFM